MSSLKFGSVQHGNHFLPSPMGTFRPWHLCFGSRHAGSGVGVRGECGPFPLHPQFPLLPTLTALFIKESTHAFQPIAANSASFMLASVPKPKALLFHYIGVMLYFWKSNKKKDIKANRSKCSDGGSSPGSWQGERLLSSTSYPRRAFRRRCQQLKPAFHSTAAHPLGPRSLFASINPGLRSARC